MQGLVDPLNLDKDVVFQKLRDSAAEDTHCGETVVIEKKTFSFPRSDVAVYAIVTNVKAFESHSLTNGDLKWLKGGLNGIETSRKRSNRRKRKSR